MKMKFEVPLTDAVGKKIVENNVPVTLGTAIIFGLNTYPPGTQPNPQDNATRGMLAYRIASDDPTIDLGESDITFIINAVRAVAAPMFGEIVVREINRQVEASKLKVVKN